MKKLLFVFSIVLLLVVCQNEDMTNGDDDETNPFVGIWEMPPDGIDQIIFTADGKFEERGFGWISAMNKYKLFYNNFGTYTYEGKVATIHRENIPGDDIIFDIDKVLFKKTSNPMIKDWLPKDPN